LDRLGTVAFIGVGLIGGSIGKAIRARKLADRVVGIGRDVSKLAEAVQWDVIDEGVTELELGVAKADVIVVCTPVTRIVDDVLSAAKYAPADVLITDAGSTKRRIVEALEDQPAGAACFVGAHPIAGSEKKGATYADAHLFDGRVCVLTPTKRTPEDRLERARKFWKTLGCRLIELDPSQHDEALALTSHLPHAVAAALAGSIPSNALPMAAGAYRDGTRVAGSDASLWTGIFRANRQELLGAVQAFQQTLDEFKSALTDNDEARLLSWWQCAKDRRAEFEPLNQRASSQD